MAQQRIADENPPLTLEQQRAIVAFSDLLNAQEALPQRVVIVDTAGRQIEVPPTTIAALAPALASAASLFALDPLAMMLADDQVVTFGQAAQLLQNSRRSVGELVASGALPAHQRAGRRRIRIGDLRAFKARQRAGIREIGLLSEALGYDE